MEGYLFLLFLGHVRSGAMVRRQISQSDRQMTPQIYFCNGHKNDTRFYRVIPSNHRFLHS